MPVVGISIYRLQRLIGVEISREQLVSALEHLGCDIEGFGELRRFRCERCGYVMEKTPTEADPGYCENCRVDYESNPDLLDRLESIDVIRLDLLAVRPDMFDVGGLSRAVRAYLGITPGMASYRVEESRFTVNVDDGVETSSCYRPAIACAVMRNLVFDDDLLKEIMRLQENLHWAMGRDRKRASIGVYDLRALTETVFYRSVDPEEIRFTPLGWDEPSTPKEIVERHPKGITFAHLLEPFSRYPLLIDDADQVLSMPPIINSEETKVSLETRDVFIDVTGMKESLAIKTLNVLTTSILEAFHGSRLERVLIRFPDGKERFTPDLTPQEKLLDLTALRRILGFNVPDETIPELLRRMGHAVEITGDDMLLVRIPAYRPDFLHERDLMEEVAIGYGYDRIPRNLVPTMTVASAHPTQSRISKAVSILTGLGYLEVMSLMLGNEDTEYYRFGLELPDSAVLLENPISTEQTLIRSWLIPGLCDFLSRNTSRELPQQVFEVGPVSVVDGDAETGARDEIHAAVAAVGTGIGFADIRSVMQTLVREYGFPFIVREFAAPYYLKGRSAAIMTDEERCIGHFGEIHPEVLERFKLSYPVVCGELSL